MQNCQSNKEKGMLAINIMLKPKKPGSPPKKANTPPKTTTPAGQLGISMSE